MATTYTVTHSFTEDTTAYGAQVNQNFTDILTAINGLDAANLTSNSVPLARISGLTTTQFAASVVDTDDTLAADSDTRLPSQSAVKDYVTNTIQAAVGSTTVVPNAYAAEESITFSNGLILKMGSESVAANTTDTVTFAEAFPTGNTYGFAVNASNSSPGWSDVVSVTTLSNTQIGLHNYGGTTITINWQAWGY